ncbi:Hypothetical protein LUCI_0775 [Lucifera butyrica]|uniref:Uncharacterized protein n=1 Tax=Lucifera butyrica TaxID=1351585 RepID=A0A498R339_9FIRM|nr:hypothetical protein [Lucifera butyrica]VBB05565.1 Hypothetical protein LUCI_0775 [Lucifera butyrica]
MPYTHGYAAGFDELIAQIIEWATDTTVHGVDAWELMRSEPWPRGTILKTHGWEEGEHFYIGLMPQAIQKGKTYSDWFLQKQVLASRFVWAADGLNLPGQAFDAAGQVITIKTYSSASSNVTYSFSSPPDIFTASAQALFFGVFKQYAEGLDWHEQPGGMDFNEIELQPIYYVSSRNTHTKMKFSPPLFPGTGYPAISMDYSGPIEGYIEYWLTKDAHRLIVVVKNREYWDMAYLGFLEPYQAKTQYAFPAVVIGGTSGAVMGGEDVVLNTGSSITYSTAVSGVRFDYRPSNWALTHGVPMFAGAPADERAALSQVRLMLPDGEWQSFANWVQGATVVNNTNSSGTVTGHSFTRSEPTRAAKIGHFLRPACSDLGGTGHVYRTNKNKLTYQMEPLEFVEDAGSVHNLFGRAWRVYWPSFRVTQYGEIRIDGKLHLMLPNAWEDRRWYIANGRTNLIDPDSLLAQENEIERLSRQMNCLVRLED